MLAQLFIIVLTALLAATVVTAVQPVDEFPVARIQDIPAAARNEHVPAARIQDIPAASTAGAPVVRPARADSSCRGTESLERTTWHMGTLLRVEVSEVRRGCGLAAMEAAVAEVDRLDSVLSSWRRDTQIGRLNAAEAGKPVEVTPELHELLLEVDGWVERTGGAFDPAVGSLIDAWQLRGRGRTPSASELAAARAASGWRHVALEPRNRVLRGPPGWWLDSGAFGKGAALRAAAAMLASHGVTSGVLDFGGQLLILGNAEAGVAHPAERSREVIRLRAQDLSVATTSSSERFVSVDGRRLGHVLDPRTGKPVPAWGSVTVAAADALAADALSTALFVMGPDAAHAWAAQEQDVGVLVLRSDDGLLSAGCNARMAELIASAPAGERQLRCESHFIILDPLQGN